MSGTKVHSNYEDLITFTRASAGHALRPVSYGSELVVNGTFDSDVSGWTANTQGTSTYQSGELRATNTSGTGPVEVYQAVTLEAGKTYVIYANVTDINGVDAQLYLSSATSYAFSSSIVTGSSTLSEGPASFSFEITSSGTYYILLGHRGDNSAGNYAQFDNVSVKEVTFDQPDGTLTLFEHPDNVPRVEWDADGNRLGLLVEESRTNKLDYSEISSWTSFTNATKTDDAVTAPDGTQTADKLIETSATGFHFAQRTVTMGASAHTVSVYLKAGERTTASIFLSQSGNVGAVFDLSSGIVSSTTGTGNTASIQDAGNGWYRCVVTNDGSADINDQIRIGIQDGALTSYTGDGSSGIYVWGAQVEEASFPTSYIKSNSGSTTTRSADVASIPVADFGFNADAGTFVLDASWAGNTTDVSTVIHMGDASDRHLVYYNNGSYRYQVKSANTVTVQAVATASEENDIIAASYKKDSFFFGDGSAISSDTSGALPAEVLTTLDIGSNLSSGYFNGHIKSIKYYPRQLTSAQLGDLV